MAADRADHPRRGDPARLRRPPAEERPYRETTPVLTPAEGARLAAAYVAEMTAREPEEITLLECTRDGGWRVGVEIVESRRIPDSADILAVYQIELDSEGELLSYRRTQRHVRSQARRE